MGGLGSGGGMCDHPGMATKRQVHEAGAGAPREVFEVDGVRIEETTPEEWQAMLEAIAQRDLGMTLAEFERAYQAGELDPCESRVAGLAILMPERTR